jgi:hypothetical protein
MRDYSLANVHGPAGGGLDRDAIILIALRRLI